MYKKHKLQLLTSFFLVFIITFYLELNFKEIASECISIISIALAIYAICISNLINSPLLEKLKNIQDIQIPTKTQLGVIKCYIQSAIIVSVFTLILAAVSKVTFTINIEYIAIIIDKSNISQIFSSLCFSLFAWNFVFILIIFIFIINKQVDIS